MFILAYIYYLYMTDGAYEKTDVIKTSFQHMYHVVMSTESLQLEMSRG